MNPVDVDITKVMAQLNHGRWISWRTPAVRAALRLAVKGIQLARLLTVALPAAMCVSAQSAQSAPSEPHSGCTPFAQDVLASLAKDLIRQPIKGTYFYVTPGPDPRHHPAAIYHWYGLADCPAEESLAHTFSQVVDWDEAVKLHSALGNSERTGNIEPILLTTFGGPDKENDPWLTAVSAILARRADREQIDTVFRPRMNGGHLVESAHLPRNVLVRQLMQARRYEDASWVAKNFPVMISQTNPALDDIDWEHGAALWRLGRRAEAKQVWNRYLDGGRTWHGRGLQQAAAAFASAQGDRDYAELLLARALLPEVKSAVLLAISVGAKDLSMADQRSHLLQPCDKAKLAALQRQYLLAFELAKRYRCERLYSSVTKESARVRMWQYQAAGLFEAASINHDELLFAHLAHRHGGLPIHGDPEPWMTLVKSLLLRQRHDDARLIFIENTNREVEGGSPHGFFWDCVASASASIGEAEQWLDLARAHARPQYEMKEAFEGLAQRITLLDRPRAQAWLDSNADALTADQRMQFRMGQLRGLANQQRRDSRFTCD